jgi:hypothetical protein
MCFIFLVGTIFPQGRDIEDYIKAGGRYVTIVRALDLLNIFTSPLFILTTGVLLINLAVCLFERLKIFLKLKRMPMDFKILKTHPKVVVVDGTDIEERLKKARFKLKTKTKTPDAPVVRVYEKGIPYWWLSWSYHVGIILAIFGFFMTALFAFERDVVLYPGRPETISLYDEETRWNKFLKKIGYEIHREEADEYILTLKEFRTEYYQGLRIDYPKDKFERLAIGIGIKRLEPSEKGFSYMPKMWLTRLEIKKPDGRVVDAEIRVNKPFRSGFLTLYQMGYVQKVKLSVYQPTKMSEEVIEVEARMPFKVKDIKGKFAIGSLKLGTLFKKDGTTERIIPVTNLYYIPEDDSSKKEVLGELRLGERIHAKGLIFEFKDYEEGSYLSYRRDPGVWLVGLACLFVFIGLFIRCFGAWYRLQCAIEDDTAYVLMSTRGIMADKERVIKKLHI